MKTSSWYRSATLGGALLLAGSALAPGTTASLAAPAAAPVNPAFVHLLPALRRAGIPLLLPTVLPIAHAYADLGSVRRGLYGVAMGYVPHCSGHACELGHLGAKRQPAPYHPPHGVRVPLSHGYTGYFMDFTCGANCGDAFLRVDYRGYRYTYALKAGSKKQLAAMASSALNAGPA